LRRGALLAALGLPGAACLTLFFLMPIGFILTEALAGGGGAFARLLVRPEFWPGVRNTLVLGLTAGGLSVFVGLAVAYHLSRLSEGVRTTLLFLIALPLTFSGLVVAFGFILAFGRAGFVTLALRDMIGVDPVAFSAFVYSPAGLAVAYSYYLIPRVVMLILPVLVNFDASQLTAAESLGASRPRAVLDVLLPQIAPTALAAFCFVAAVAFGTYGTALALVGTQVNILPLQLFALVSDVNTDFAVTAALALLLTALCSLLMGLGEGIASRGEH
jgi:putative spermidine/putrescine transport system permease protein